MTKTEQTYKEREWTETAVIKLEIEIENMLAANFDPMHFELNQKLDALDCHMDRLDRLNRVWMLGLKGELC